MESVKDLLERITSHGLARIQLVQILNLQRDKMESKQFLLVTALFKDQMPSNNKLLKKDQ
jgi:hypothetical protein